MTGISVSHDPVAGRFSARVDGHECRLDYVPEAGRMIVVHTGVPAAVGGRGIAAALVTEALGYARREGLRVVPRCSYVAAFVRRHPEYRDLVDPA